MIVGTSRIIFLIFLITCSIILMNLTQGEWLVVSSFNSKGMGMAANLNN